MTTKIFNFLQDKLHFQSTCTDWYRFKHIESKSYSKNCAYNPSIDTVINFSTKYDFKSMSGFKYAMRYITKQDYKRTKAIISSYEGVEFDRDRAALYRLNAATYQDNYVGKTKRYLNSVSESILSSSDIAIAARAYLQSRGISDYQADFYGLRVGIKDKYLNRVIIPYFEDKKIVYFNARDFTGTSRLKYINPTQEETDYSARSSIYNIDSLNTYDTIYVVEGAFDAMMIGSDCIALGSYTLKRDQLDKLINTKKKHYIFIPDFEGYDKFKQQTKKLCVFHKVSMIDTRNLGEGDPCFWGRDKVLSCPQLPALAIEKKVKQIKYSFL